MESPEPFFYFHPFHWNIYICYELNEFLWLFNSFSCFFWWCYNNTLVIICQYIFTFYFNIFWLSLSYLHEFYNSCIYLIIFRLFIFLRRSTFCPESSIISIAILINNAFKTVRQSAKDKEDIWRRISHSDGLD